ncbi:MAG: flippase-like domain-containing protein, partial [Gemmatimonadetes bacterium]|nr:flippase-like domain-containing protein [Gemmatimonadota bacterium]
VKLALIVLISSLILRGAGLTLAEAWRVDWTIVEFDVPLLAASFAILLVTFAIPAALWSRVIVTFGEKPIPVFPATAMILVSNLGRYIPGKVAQIAGMAYLARRAGVSPVHATGAAVVAQILNLISAATLGGWVAYQTLGAGNVWSLAAGLGAVVAMVGFLYLGGAEALMRRFLKRVGEDCELPPAAGRRLLLWLPGYFVNWLVHGAAFALLASGLGIPVTWGVATTAFAAAYFAGYMSLLPAGIGVRESSLVLLLTPLLGAGPSVVLAVLHRVWISVIEFAGAGVAGLFLQRTGPHEVPGRPDGPERSPTGATPEPDTRPEVP